MPLGRVLKPANEGDLGGDAAPDSTTIPRDDYPETIILRAGTIIGGRPAGGGDRAVRSVSDLYERASCGP
jgi:hypothetical protein